MQPISMVDLRAQYLALAPEILPAIQHCIENSTFIGGTPVQRFQQNLQQYLGARHVIPCANGTDALQLAMMALGLQPGDEVIVPAFTYVATAEVIGLLRLVPVMVDVDKDTFNVTARHIRAAITERTRAVVPVHLFGQCCDMEPILELAREYRLHIIEDNAQAIGAQYTFSDGEQQAAGTLGAVGCTSFYPSKNLGAYGDGGAMFTQDDQLATLLRSIANHGQSTRRYYHEQIGANSRLDAIQAAVLDIKLRHLDSYVAARRRAADFYDRALSDITAIRTPYRAANSTHVFHQYTLQVPADQRDALKTYLEQKGIPSMIYYPVPLYEQPAYQAIARRGTQDFSHTEQLCRTVLSLPMHTELSEEQLQHITGAIRTFFGQ